MAWARYWSRRRLAAAGSAVKVRIWGAVLGFSVGVVFQFEDGDGGWGGLFYAAGGTVLGTDGAAALALGEHVLRGHGRPAFGFGVRGAQGDEAGGEDHGEGDPLDGVEEACRGRCRG